MSWSFRFSLDAQTANGNDLSHVATARGSSFIRNYDNAVALKSKLGAGFLPGWSMRRR
jgi:hypothetical protein